MVGWQSSPDRRGTSDILENCLFTIVTSIWSVQHLNLPSPRDGLGTQLLRKAKWSVLAILFPEVLLVQAVAERYTATKCMDMFENAVGIRVVRSTWMSKFKKRWDLPRECDEEDAHRIVGSTNEQSQDQLATADVTERSDFTLVHAHYAVMGGFRLLRTNEEKPVEAKHRSNVLNALQLAHMCRQGFLAPGRLPSKDEIKNKSKSNAFTKAIALIQICRLLISVIARGCQGLEISQLEIITLAFVGCTLLTYAFWWNKPQDVDTPTLLAVTFQEGEWAVIQRERMDSLWQMLFPSHATELPFSDRIPNDNILISPALIRSCAAVGATATITFGSLHLIAWNFTFPTAPEKWMWRTAGVVAAYLPLLPLAINYITAALEVFERKDATRFLHTLQLTYREFVMSSDTKPRTKNELLSRLEELTNEAHGRKRFTRYRQVFDVDSSAVMFRADLHKYVHELRYSDPSYPRFPQELKRLFNILDDFHDAQQPYQYDDDADLIDLFPKIQRKERQMNDKSLQGLDRQKANVRRLAGYIGDDLVKLWPRKSFFVLSAGLYCLARLSVLALAVASLRLMPDSVYDLSWMN
ncbi:MAG: hypothetical protein Q9182_004572 [Xanthomendoza sp. 2 TL-2023]